MWSHNKKLYLNGNDFFHSKDELKDVVVIVDIVSLKIVDSKMLFMPRICFT